MINRHQHHHLQPLSTAPSNEKFPDTTLFTRGAMSTSLSSPIIFLIVSMLQFTAASPAMASNVTYDGRSLIIDGQRKLLISSSIHYPRSAPAMWPGLVQLAKEGGAEVIESYVFWNGHEPSPDNYYFEDRFDVVKFVKIVQQAGMYMMLRIGPFVAAEWNYGGVPIWLHYVPGCVFRTDNEPFKYHMEKFTTYIVNLMKKEKLFASQGGPIVLAQIENEYAWYEQFYGGGKAYAMWAAQMALSQNTGVPWIMCEEYDAPYPVEFRDYGIYNAFNHVSPYDLQIDTCNSFYCDTYVPNSPLKPKFWTENWPGWFKTFGAPDPHRPPEDIAFAVARFFQKGGSLQNYYMYHGGTNFGRTGATFLTTSYDYDAPIDEYGMARFPKWGHLKELHASIKLVEQTLLRTNSTLVSLGPLQEADVYEDASGACAAFLANMDDKNDTVVAFRSTTYNLPAWSVSILPDCKNVVFNTAKVGVHTSIVEMVPEHLQLSAATPKKVFGGLHWEVFKEKLGLWAEADLIRTGFTDSINTTKDKTDYLWLTTSFHVDEKEIPLNDGSQPFLTIQSKGHVVHAFWNKEFKGTGYGNDFSMEVPISLNVGKNDIALLSMTLGLHSAGTYYEWTGTGITGVQIRGLNNGTVDLSKSTWNYKIGLLGEHLKLHQADGWNNVKRVAVEHPLKKRPLTWYKAVVDAPSGNDPVGLDMINMGKGQAWLNGKEIGRFWSVRSSKDGKCVEECDYRGTFSQEKCLTGCGEPSQRWYHVPRSWFKPRGNVLVILEETGKNPNRIRFSKRRISGICSLLSEDHPSGVESWSFEANENNDKATARLSCPDNACISTIKFASFGNPAGSCGSYSIGECHDPESASVVEKLCLNKRSCGIELSGMNFDMSLCPGMVRWLAVEAVCS